MTTLGDIAAEISDDIDDTTGEYADQIRRAVRAAQRYCERHTFYFNETRDVTFPTVEGQEWYDENDAAEIPTLVRIVAAYSEDAQGQRSTTLRRADPSELETLSDNSASTGEPSCFAYFGQRIRLYPIPGATSYTIRLQLGPYRLATLDSDSDTNAWLAEAYDMLKAYALHVLWRDTLKQDSDAIKYMAVFNAEKDALDKETSSRNGTGRIRPTEF